MTDPLTLIERYLVNELTDAEHAELASWLAAEESNRAAFLAEVDFYRTVRGVLISEQRELAHAASNDTADSVINAGPNLLALAEMEADAEITGPVDITEQMALREQIKRERQIRARYVPPAEPSPTNRTYVIPRLVVWGGLAAVLLLGALLTIQLLPKGDAGSKKFVEDVLPPSLSLAPARIQVAQLQSTEGCVWSMADPLNAGDGLLAGKYELIDGMATLRFAGGAVLNIESPASFTLDSATAMTLHDGRAVGYCDASARGFVVRTPHAELVDLGTEFGVWVDPQEQTQLHVFAGEVQASLIDEQGRVASSQIVHEDQAVSARVGSGRISLLAKAETDVFAVTRQIDLPIWSTGEGVSLEDKVDPHWQVTRINGETLDQPAPTIGHGLKENYTSLAALQLRKSVIGELTWIIPDPDVDSAEQDSYTYETRFSLAQNIELESLLLEIGFVADNYVSEIRLNGQPVPVPEHAHQSPYLTLTRTAASRGFITGENRLEIVIHNLENQSGRTNRTALMAELKLTGQQRWKPASSGPEHDQ